MGSKSARTLGLDDRQLMVREGGLEPPHPCEYWHLKPARLPIPPLAHVGRTEARQPSEIITSIWQ
jgi:hypothetical protein